jgi:hypothetical protein
MDPRGGGRVREVKVSRRSGEDLDCGNRIETKAETTRTKLSITCCDPTQLFEVGACFGDDTRYSVLQV